MSGFFDWSKGVFVQGGQQGLNCTDLKTLCDEHNSLTQQKNQLTNMNQMLLRQKNDANAHNDRLRAQLVNANQTHLKEKNDAKTCIDKLRAEKSELTENLNRLRQMLVPASENHISDSEIIQKFTNLRSQIQGLVRQTWNMKLKQEMGFHASEAQKRFFGGLWTGDDVHWKCPYERLRCAVFTHLDDYIFDSRSYFLKPEFAALDDALGISEKDMWNSCSTGGM